MELLNTYQYKLRFYIDSNAPPLFMKRWEKLKKDCENCKNKYILEEMKNYFKLDTNKNLPLLKRIEGGLGGNNNTIHKQIRFRFYISEDKDNYYAQRDDDIVFSQIYNTEYEKWTLEELDDIIQAFIETANYYVGEECVEGCIEMFKKDL